MSTNIIAIIAQRATAIINAAIAHVIVLLAEAAFSGSSLDVAYFMPAITVRIKPAAMAIFLKPNIRIDREHAIGSNDASTLLNPEPKSVLTVHGIMCLAE